MGVYLRRAKVSQLDFVPPELVAFFCVACYKDPAPTEPFFKSLLGESLAAFRSYIPHGL